MTLKRGQKKMSFKKKLTLANEAYEKLIIDANPRVQNSLATIKKVCDMQSSRETPDFSIAHIGRLSLEQGGPKEQTIRNKTSSAQFYRTLIKTYADLFRGKSETLVKAKPTSIEAKIDSLEDVQLRWALFDLVSENKKLKNQLQTCEAALKVPTSYTSNNEALSNTPQLSLDNDDIKALAHFTSPENLKHHGWSISEYGQVIASNGKAISKVGFKDAIDKATNDSSQLIFIEEK